MQSSKRAFLNPYVTGTCNVFIYIISSLFFLVFVFVIQVLLNGNIDQMGKAVKAGELLIICDQSVN